LIYLSRGDLFDVSCVKDELCATTSALHASAENKRVMHVARQSDELHLLSSLHTLGYIEFDDLCNLNCLEERVFAYADLPWLSKYSYHVIGKYNNKGQYMVHRVYICTNLNSPFVLQDCDQLESNQHTNIFTCSSSSFISQEGKHYWWFSMIFGAEFSCNKLAIPVVSFVGTDLLQDSNDKHNVSFNNEVSRDAGNFMRHDMIHNWKHGHIPPHNYFDLLYFRNPVLCCVVQDHFQVQSASRTTFLQKGENDEDMATMLMSMHGAWIGEDGVHQGSPSQEGGPRLIPFESLRWRPKAIQVRA
jgi:hypothetical protein